MLGEGQWQLATPAASYFAAGSGASLFQVSRM